MAQSFEGNTTINTWMKGMNMDLDKAVVPTDTYTYAENIRLVVDDSGTLSALTPAAGLKQLNIVANTQSQEGDLDLKIKSEKIIAVHYIREFVVVFTEWNGTYYNAFTGATTEGWHNSIYKLNLNGDNVVSTRLTTQKFNIGWESDVNFGEFHEPSITSRWENSDNVKVYWADGYHALRTINIANDWIETNKKSDVAYFESSTSSSNVVLPAPEFNKFVTGNLKSGSVIYVYQLFNVRDARTKISSVSPIISISNSRDRGLEPGEDTSRGVQLSVNIPTGDFKMLRLYSIYFKSRTDVPEVKIVKEVPVSENGTVLVTDDGSSLSTITEEELASEDNYLFIARIIENKDDRLFAANIVEDTWSLPGHESPYWYDTRAFQFTKPGGIESTATLVNQAGDPTIIYQSDLYNSTYLQKLPYNHDCINPANFGENIILPSDKLSSDLEFLYVAESNLRGRPTFGASGKNVEIRAVFGEIGEGFKSYDAVNNIIQKALIGPSDDSYTLNSEMILPEGQQDILKTRSHMYLYRDINQVHSPILNTHNSANTIRYKIKPEGVESRYITYGDEYINSKVRGYQRDSIYRFGAIFYDKVGRVTPVNWICDLRTPSLNQARLFDQNSKIVLNDDPGTVTVRTATFETVLYPLGFEFVFSNLPEEVVKVEIVRCKREVGDRTVLAQGIISKTSGVHGDGKYSLPIIPTIGSRYTYGIVLGLGNRSYGVDNSSTAPYCFMSPEISFNKEIIADRFSRDLYLNTVYGLNAGFIRSVSNIPIAYAGRGTHHVPNSSDISPVDDYMARITDSGSITFLNSTSGAAVDKVFPSMLSQKFFNPANTFYNYQTNSDRDTFSDIYKLSEFELAKNYNPLATRDEVRNDTQSVAGKSIINHTIMWDHTYGRGLYVDGIKQGAGGVKAYMAMDTGRSIVDDRAFGDKFVNGFQRWGATGSTIHTRYFETPSVRISISDHVAAQFNAHSCTVLTNIKQLIVPYGGLGYISRNNSTYVSTGASGTIMDGDSNFIVFGGDIFLGVHSYMWTYSMLHKEEGWAPEGGNRRWMYVHNYFPCESTVNLSLTHGFDFRNEVNNNRLPNFVTLEPNAMTNVDGTFIQEQPMYRYNSAYSTDGSITKTTHYPKGTYSKSNNSIDYRVIYSGVKINEELGDSWVNFKAGDYLDVDTRYGSINRLKVFQDKLYFWQDNAFGVLSVNPRSLTTDNLPGELLLGTGRTLDRYDYITTNNGSKPNVLGNIGETPSFMWWYDHARGEVVSYANTTSTTSKIKGIQSTLNKEKHNVSNDVTTVYDQKFNEAHTILRGNFTDGSEYKHLVYNEQTESFSSFYTYDARWFSRLDNKLISFRALNDNTNEIYLNNEGKPNNFYGNVETSKIKYLVNTEFSATKVFDNVYLYADNLSASNKISFDFETSSQITSTDSTETIINGKREDEYKLHIPRSKQDGIGRMRGKWMSTTLSIKPTFPNESESVEFNIPYITTSYRRSNI